MTVNLQQAVLVVDDEAMVRALTCIMLCELGFHDVDSARDGLEALRKMRKRTYGLVLSDWNMEPMTGYELLQQVRSDLTIARTPFVMVTGESRREHIVAAMQAGADAYLLKPLRIDTLSAKIRDLSHAESCYAVR